MTKARFASLTAGLLARKGEAAPPVAMFNKAAPVPESPAQFEDVSPDMQERIDTIVESPQSPSNWTHPPIPIETPPPSLDLESEYGMDDQRGGSAQDAGVPIRYGLLSRPGASKDKANEAALFTRITPLSAPQFGRRKDGHQSERGQIVSMPPKKKVEPANDQPPQEEPAQEEPPQYSRKIEAAVPPTEDQRRTLIVSRARAPSVRRTAITLRLDEERYLRLKYAGAQLGKTSQAILETALDRYLTSLGNKFTHDTEWLRRTVSIVQKGSKS